MKSTTATRELDPAAVEQLRQAIAEETGVDVEAVSLAEVDAYLRLLAGEDEPAAEDTVLRRFAQQVESRGDTVALVSEGEEVSYRQLDRRSDLLARELRRRGAGPGVPVVFAPQPASDAAVRILGVLKASACCAPCDPGREGDLRAGALAGLGAPLLLPADEPRDPGAAPEEPLPDVSAELPAWIEAVSGLCLDHRALAARLDRLETLLGREPAETVAAGTSLTELLWPLTTGRRVVSGALPVDVAWSRPRDLDAEEVSAGIRRLLLGGEPLRRRVAERALRRATTVCNVYALPEAGGEVAAGELRPGETGDPVPYGTGLDGRSVYVLDRFLQAVPDGVVGELFVGGEDLAWGYLGDPRETAQRFLPDPFAAGADRRMVRSGDRGRRRRQSGLELDGSADHRAWIGGVRVDLGELEGLLLEDPAIDDCALLAREPEDGSRELVAYVVAAGPVPVERLHERLSSVVDAHLLPATYVQLASLPVDRDGRIDRPALAALPVVVPETVAALEEELRRRAGAAELAVVQRQAAPQQPALHLADLLPTEAARWIAPESEAGAVAEEEESAPRRPAVSHGPVRRTVDGAPRTLPQALARAARQSDEQGCYYHGDDGTVVFQSYADLLAEAERILGGLRRQGRAPGTGVILQLSLAQDFFPAFWGCLLAGLVPVPVAIPPSYRAAHTTLDKLKNAWQLLARPPILTTPELAPEVCSIGEGWRALDLSELRSHPPDADWHRGEPDELTLLLLTSGSTGVPKAVMQSHGRLLAMADGSAAAMGLSGEDVAFNWMPLDHVGALAAFHLMPVWLGCRQVHMPTPAVLGEPLGWLDWMDHYRVSFTWAPNFAFGLINSRAPELVERSWDLSSLRRLINAGETIVPSTARSFLELLAPHGLRHDAMCPSFGMSETCSACVCSCDFSRDSGGDDSSAVDLGPPIAGVSLRFVDGDGEVISEGVTGRLQVRGDSVTAGYYENPEANAQRFTADGWFDTGDVGFLRDGRLFLTGRQEEVIVLHGVNYPCQEIEAVAEKVERVEVSFTAACALHNALTRSDELAIFFSPADGEDPAAAELCRQVRERLVAEVGLRPEVVVPVPRQQIPKTGIGKIQRLALRDRLLAGDFDDVLRHLDLASRNARTLPAWFYERVWRSRAARPHRRLRTGGRALVLRDRRGLGEALARRLRRQGLETIEVDAGAGYAQLGPRHFRIDPEAAEGYGRMIAALAGDGPPIDWIFHLWTCDERHRELDDAPALEAAQELGALSVLRLVRALSSELGGDLASVFKVRLFVVSSHAQPVADDEILRVENGTLPGLIHTLARELSWLDPRHLDLAPGETASDAAVLVAEARDASADREVAWRSGRRLVPRLREVDFAAADSSGPGFRQGGCYLLTGGLGGLGAETARSLLTRYQARLLLLGKSSLPETGEPLATLQALRELPGEVSYQAVDVGDAERLRAVVEEAERRWDRPLDGVLHLAASHRDRPLLEETDASLASTLHPKLRGSWVLDRVLADRQLDFFVHYSSVLAFLGGAGAGAYAAANSFQDRFVYHQRRRGRRAFCFAWSQWEDLGLSRGLPAPGSTTGVRRIDPERGFHSVQGGLRQTAAYLAIGLDASRPGLRRLGVTEASLTHRLSAFTTAAEAELSDASLSLSDRYGNLHRCELVRLAEMPRTEDGEVDVEALTTARGAAARRNVAPRNALERQLREIWRRLLGVERIGVFDDFFDLGGDSILATQFVSRAKQSGLELAPKELFEHKTIAALAAAYGRGPKAQAEQGPVTGPTPLLPSQHWFFDMHLPRPDHFNHYYYLELRDPLPPGVLREAIAHLLRHHDALRLRFERHPDGWRAHLAAPDAQVAFTLVDLSRVPESERPGVLEALGDRFQASLDLGAGPILRVAHFRFGPGSPERLAIVVHHLAVDLISRSFLLEDLQTAIEQLSSGEAVALPAKTSSVQRWGERLRDHARTPEVEAELDYWLAEARYRVPPVPLDHPGGRYTNISDAVVRGGLDEDATASLLNAQRRLGPAETLLLTAIAQTFRPWTGASALSVDVVNYGRSPIFDDLDVSRTTGWFAAPYPLLVDPGDAADTTEAVRRVQAQIDAVPASGLGHGLLRYLHPDAEVREKLRAVPRSILDFSYLGEMLADPDSLSLLRELRQDIGNPQDPRGEWCYSMSIFAFVLDGRLRLSWRYSENLHRRATIEELMNRLVQRLAEMAFPARKESPGHRAAKRT